MSVKAGLYVHIPFCKRKCTYCNFHFSTNLHNIDALIEALSSEMASRKDEAQGYEIQSLYFGGGTPSLLNTQQWNKLFTSLKQHYDLDLIKEITVEINPDDVNSSLIDFLSDWGVNRWSVGVQSFFDEDMHWMNRSHTSGQSIEALELLSKNQSANISIDLIFGLPGSGLERWKQNLSRITDFNVSHLSCYALTIEEKTALHHQVDRKKIIMEDDHSFIEQMDFLYDWCPAQGFENYEISNASKNGYRSLHNSSYWAGNPYLGFGPSAHSFDGKHRRWNIAHNLDYIKYIEKNEKFSDQETLTESDLYNEFIMTRIRLIEGIPISSLEDDFYYFYTLRLKEFQQWTDTGYLLLKNHSLVLSRKGRHLADRITRDLFI